MVQLRGVPVREAAVSGPRGGGAGLAGPAHEAALLRRLRATVDACREAGVWGLPSSELTAKWRTQLEREPLRLVQENHTINAEALRRFRRLQIFVPDIPIWDPGRLSLVNLLGGGRRGDRRALDACLDFVQSSSCEPLLRKHPCPLVGRPYVFRRRGYVYTYRWLKHIWSLGLVKDVLSSRLPEDFVTLDIGSSYGIFSGLVKREWPRSHHVLVDFPEQLLLAHYFLSMWLPGCRIAGIPEVLEQPRLAREWIMQHDFTLVPCARYDRIEGGVADLVTNFASFGEMTRSWFDFYVNAPPFQAARYLFLINRIQSRPSYETDLTILDYPIWDRASRLHFSLATMFSNVHFSRRRWLFCSRQVMSSQYFEYIGSRGGDGHGP